MRWCITTGNLILGVKNGQETLLRRTQKGVPSGSLRFNTEAQAWTEISILIAGGHWPLFMPDARAERIDL